MQLLLAMLISGYALAQGDAPALLRGQAQASSAVGAFIQTPQSQVTKISSSTALIETGSYNILANPGFEHQSYLTGWTTSGSATFSSQTSGVAFGVKYLQFVTAGNSGLVSQDQSTTELSGQDCVVSAWVNNTAPGTSVCLRTNGTSTGICSSATNDGVWKLYQVYGSCGSSSTGVEVHNGTTAGTTKVDNLSVGALPPSSLPSLLPIARGGTNKALSLAAGGVIWSDADSFEVSTAGTTGQFLKSGGTGAPTWSSSVNLASEVTGVLPVANGGSNKALTLAAGGVVWTDSDSFEVAAAGTSGQLLQSNGAAAPSWTTIAGMTTPGMTNPKFCPFRYGGASEPSSCTASPCTEYWDPCGIWNAATRGGTGDYSLTSANSSWANNTRLVCFQTCHDGGSLRMGYTQNTAYTANGSGAVTISVYCVNNASPQVPSDNSVNGVCIGESP